jgi:xanthine dehydrogenase accessory factor
MLHLYRKALDLSAKNLPAVLSTVIHTEGSTPQKAGSQALMDGDGRLWGTLGGGLVEADGLDRMRRALADGTSSQHEYRLDEEYSRNAGPICGGVMRFYTQPDPGNHREAINSAIVAFDSNERGLLITHLAGPQKDQVRWIAEETLNGSHAFPSREQLKDCLNREVPKLVEGDDGAEAYVEPVVPTPRLLIVGGGHVGQTIALQAKLAGFDVTVYDDREEFAAPDLFPADTALASGNIKQLVSEYPKGPNCYIVLVSKGHLLDALALEACIHDHVRFLGMIGSRRKILALKKHFIEDGLATDEEWSRIISPIGYDIGAVTVSEIGFSIVAQLIAARRLPSSVCDISAKSL